MNTLLVVLSMITALYFFMALVGRPFIERRFGKRWCAMCTSVMTVWAVLLVAYYAGWNVDPIILAMLLGGCVIGMMYRLERMFERRHLRGFWFVRVVEVVFGFALAYGLIQKMWTIVIVSAVALSVSSFITALTNVRSRTVPDPIVEKFSPALSEKMKHCCDD